MTCGQDSASAQTSSMGEVGDTVTIGRAEFERLLADARSWRKHNSDEWRAYREWLLEYEIAQRIRQASYDVAGYLHPKRRPNSEAARVGAVLAQLEPEGWQ
jgi:hypothetical protein